MSPQQQGVFMLVSSAALFLFFGYLAYFAGASTLVGFALATVGVLAYMGLVLWALRQIDGPTRREP